VAEREKDIVDRSRADEATERRFNETVRNLLNTPHKPHKARRSASAEASSDPERGASLPFAVAPEQVRMLADVSWPTESRLVCRSADPAIVRILT
jgi:hypothetical protein